jgi:hypothetical protein
MILRGILLSLLVFSVPLAALACTCSDTPPGKCAGLQNGNTVFLGTVTEVQELAPSASEAPANAPLADATGGPIDQIAARITRYHFHIDEAFSLASASGAASAAGSDPGNGSPDTQAAPAATNAATPASAPTEIDIYSGGQDGDCGYKFKKGEQYLVYGQPESEGRLFATVCNGTRPADDARALIPQLRAMARGQRVASVFGVLRRADPPFLAPPGDPDDPLAKVSLKLRSRFDRFETGTDRNGVYSFYDVHGGEYSFTAKLPARMELTQKTLHGGLPPFKIPDGACYEYDVDALPTGHIHGSVLGPDKKPLSLASVELYRAGSYSEKEPGLWSFQDSRGFFDFDHIGPGDYVLVYNRMNRLDPNAPYPRTFFPGVTDANDAQPITLKDGQQLAKVNLLVSGGLETRTLRVRLDFAGGRLPGSVAVAARAAEGDNPAATKVGDSLYQFTLLASTNYTISAWEDLLPARTGAKSCSLPARIETPAIDVAGSDTATKQILLVFPDVTCTKQ